MVVADSVSKRLHVPPPEYDKVDPLIWQFGDGFEFDALAFVTEKVTVAPGTAFANARVTAEFVGEYVVVELTKLGVAGVALRTWNGVTADVEAL